jgi:hypothetical protein
MESQVTDNPRWRKSSFSGNGGAECVETASHAGDVLVRDTKDRERGVITVNAASWRVFTEMIKTRLPAQESAPGSLRACGG